MSDPYDEHEQPIVVNFINDAVVTDPNPPKLLFPGELDGTPRAWIQFQGRQRGEDSPLGGACFRVRLYD